MHMTIHTEAKSPTPTPFNLHFFTALAIPDVPA